MRKIVDLSPNTSKKIRSKKLIKFVIIHYTGMQSEIESLERLKDKLSKVSCHYLINRKGDLTQMVNDNKVAWHAGKSKWKNFNNLNKFSLGIELVNRGHKFKYENFSLPQINRLIKLCKKLKKKYKIKPQNFLGHSDIAPLRKVDPGEKFPWKKLSKFNLGIWYKDDKCDLDIAFDQKKNYFFFKNLYKIGYRYFHTKKRKKKDHKIIRAFQSHYLPEKVSGKIDQKTLGISHFLANLR